MEGEGSRGAAWWFRSPAAACSGKACLDRDGEAAAAGMDVGGEEGRCG